MRALIVDDSSFIRQHLRALLSKMGMTCAEAVHGAEALQTLEGARGAEAFDLMFVDMNMPVMNGMDCLKGLKRMRESRPELALKVMMVTTEADTAFICEALDFGADEFLMKPFTPESLRDKMSMLGFASA